jgi:hypothetical protein
MPSLNQAAGRRSVLQTLAFTYPMARAIAADRPEPPFHFAAKTIDGGLAGGLAELKRGE